MLAQPRPEPPPGLDQPSVPQPPPGIDDPKAPVPAPGVDAPPQAPEPPPGNPIASAGSPHLHVEVGLLEFLTGAYSP